MKGMTGAMTVCWKLFMLWLFAANSIIQTAGDALKERPTDIGNEVEESPVYIYICNGPKSNTTYKECQITRDPDVCYHVGTLSMYRSCTDICNDVEQHSEEEDTCRRYSQCGVYLRENCQLTLKNPPTTAAAAAAPAPTTESAVGKTAEEGKEQSAAVAKYEKVVPDINEESVDNGRVGLTVETIASIAVVAVILAIVMAVVGVTIHKKRSQRNGPQPDPNPAMEMQDMGGGQNDAVVIDVPVVVPQQPEVGPENMETEPFLRDNHGVQNTDTNDCGSGRPMPMETNRRKSF